MTAHLERGLMLLPASANVVMQLSRRAVGRGVAESKVSSRFADEATPEAPAHDLGLHLDRALRQRRRAATRCAAAWTPSIATCGRDPMTT